ncbi:MAG: RAD55 family ATPase [Candidatus Methanofastidiosia archaeon]
MNLKVFKETLERLGYDEENTEKVFDALLEVYTKQDARGYRLSERGVPFSAIKRREVSVLLAFKLCKKDIVEGGELLSTTPMGERIAKVLIQKRIDEGKVFEKFKKKLFESFFILKYFTNNPRKSELNFLLNHKSMRKLYDDVSRKLLAYGLAFKTPRGLSLPSGLFEFFEDDFAEFEEFERYKHKVEEILLRLKLYRLLSLYNKREKRCYLSRKREFLLSESEIDEILRGLEREGLIENYSKGKKIFSFEIPDSRKYLAFLEENFLKRNLRNLNLFLKDPERIFQELEEDKLPLREEKALPKMESPKVLKSGWDAVGLSKRYSLQEDVFANILIFGDPSPYKQLFCQQFLWGELNSGKGGIYLNYNTPPDDVRKNFERFGKEISEFERKKNFVFIDCFPWRQKKSSERFSAPIEKSSLFDFGLALTETIKFLKREHGSVVFDSISNLMIYFEPDQVIKFAINQASKLKEIGWTGLFIVEKGVNDERIENSLKFLLDAVFEIRSPKNILSGRFDIHWMRGVVDKPVSIEFDVGEDGFRLLEEG